MRKSVGFGFGFVVMLAVGVFLVLICCGELSYRNRTLTSWLQECSDASLEETQRLAVAQEAVRAIGAQKALPHLLRLIKAKDNRIVEWLEDKGEKVGIHFFHRRSALERQLQGIAGFEALGTNTAPAVGDLTTLLDDKEFAFVAARCLEHTGKAAESALCQCLTNQDWQIRHLSVPALASVTDDVEIYLARIQDRLRDGEPSVRFATVQAVGDQDNAPELAIPLLIPALADTSDGVCEQAAHALAGFGTNAASAFATLANLVNTGRPAQTRAALKALPAIAPDEALPVLSNAVVNGSLDTFAAALKSLKTIAPELALKMTLAEFHSSDALRRFRTVGLAVDYEVTTPGIADALKAAAADPDPELAKRATMTMRHMLNKKKETKGSNVDLPNEPSYQGKPLGEWLRLRQAGGELATNAVEALRQMGTNAIPALLARLSYCEPAFNLYDYDVSMQAVGAFIALGERAKPALPVLTAMMDSEDQGLAVRAMLATLGTGVDALPCLMKGLTNRFPEVREEALNNLTGGWSALFPEQRQQAVPFLVPLLSDPDANVRWRATNELKALDPKTAAAAGIK